MSIRKSLMVGLAVLAILGALQSWAAVLGNRRLYEGLANQTRRLAAVSDVASAQLAFERAERAAQASKHGANSARRYETAETFRAEGVNLRNALTSATELEPALAALLPATAEWVLQTDQRLPGSTAGPQAQLLRDDLLSQMHDARQLEIATALSTMLKRADLARATAVQEAVTAESLILASVALAGFASIWLALVLRHRVLRPLSGLTQTTLLLADGKLDCTVEGLSRSDEIGAVATALDTLRRRALHTVAVEAAAAKERAASDARIRFLAHYDQLTGLANRTMLNERLDQAIALARRSNQRLALFWIDLDHFKAVNDSQGHAAGDTLLREVARRLLEAVRETDTVARIGGDEFVVVQVDMHRSQGADQLANRLIASLSELYDIGSGQQAVVTASIGVAVYPDDGEAAAALLANADLAMYRVKGSGRNSYAFFQAEMDQEAQMRQKLEQDLRLALAREQFTLVFQPQLNVLTGKVLGFEALLRWFHPERGLISPELFIPIAESSGAIVSIGEWVLRQACREARRWSVPLRIAVNVSPVQFQQCDMAKLVEDTLESSGLDPTRLELEVTESTLIRDPERTFKALGRIRQSGVTIALDDFGTGYSSLSTLRSFPFDRIKLDRSFVRDLMSCHDAAAIVHAVLGLAHGLGLPVIAEGVEHHEQLEILKELGCAEVQGYLIGTPEPINFFDDLTGTRVVVDAGSQQTMRVTERQLEAATSISAAGNPRRS